MLGIGGGTGAGFAATSANASNGNAIKTCFKPTLPNIVESYFPTVAFLSVNRR